MLNQLEGYAHSRQLAERVIDGQPFGVDDSQCRRQVVGQIVVIGDDHVTFPSGRPLDGGEGIHTRVAGDEQRSTLI